VTNGQLAVWCPNQDVPVANLKWPPERPDTAIIGTRKPVDAGRV
jgi:hypothetical protein